MADSYEIDLEIQGGEQPEIVMEAEGGATDGASARNAEAWANGTRNGVPVEEGDPAYNKSSKYYRDSAAAIAAGDVIDDDAGHGDTMLAWSADKLVGEFGGKAPVIVVSDDTAEAVKTFSDGADGMPMGLTVGVEPVQDLHGQDAPYPAGGGKNIGHLSATNIYSEQQNTNTYVNNGVVVTGVGAYARCGFSIPVVTGETYTVSAKCKRGSVSVQRIGLSNETGWHYTYGILGTISETLSALSKTITATSDTLCVEVYPGSDSAVITIEDFQVEKNSSATSFAPYSNICPISGWTGAEVCVAEHYSPLRPDAVNEFTQNGVTFDVKKYPFINVKGTAAGGTAYSGTIGTTFQSFKLPAGTYTLKAIGDISSVNITVQFESGSGISNASLTANNPEVTFTFTGEYGIGWYLNVQNGATANAHFALVYSTGKVYSIAFPSSAGTVYGGTLTVNADGTGTLVVDTVVTAINEGTLSGIGYESDGQFYYGYLPAALGTPVFLTGQKANYLRTGAPSATNKNCILAYPSRVVRLNISTIDQTVESYNQYLNDNALQFVFMIATPQVYTISAPQVETLKGMNNLWADTGDIKAVDYPADSKLYIDGKIAELQALILENISNS